MSYLKNNLTILINDIPNKTMKQYYENNKGELRKQQYYKQNERNEKHICACGGIYNAREKYKHLNTNKHLKFIASLCDEQNDLYTRCSIIH